MLPIPAIRPRGAGYQFVLYADACSGVPGAPHEATFAAVNHVVARLDPPPELICFAGDEIQGLSADADALRAQWRHWLTQEMSWLDRAVTPLYHSTGNHTAYDPLSRRIFREMLDELPQNGPPGLEGLTYFVRRGDLLLAFVDTLDENRGGEGRVESVWLDQTLAAHADARYKLVIGHHPVFPVNGFSGSYQRELAPDDGAAFWATLRRHNVLAYLCSHILAFDVQVHQGVLQILSGGAGTAHRMPAGQEYLHCVQLALDEQGLRYQVLDEQGQRREYLEWPPALPPAADWTMLAMGAQPAPVGGPASADPAQAQLLALRFSGRCTERGGPPQTLMCAWDPGPDLAPLWIGLIGAEQRLAVSIGPQRGRSPHLWHGPPLAPGRPFDLQLLLHSGMGPGGILWRAGDSAPWSSLRAASPWGVERLTWPERWSIGQGRDGERPFLGQSLQASLHR